MGPTVPTRSDGRVASRARSPSGRRVRAAARRKIDRIQSGRPGSRWGPGRGDRFTGGLVAIDDLPGPVATFLNVIGVPWPYIDEDQIRQFATMVRQFGRAVEQTHLDATQTM